MTHSVHTSAYKLLPFEEGGNRRKNLSSSCDCISTFQVEVEDFDNEIFVLSVEAHDKEEASTIAERICAESEITVPLRYDFYKGTRRIKLLDSREIRTVRDVCIFEINGMEVFM